jgi:hypothetical protein
MRQLLFALCIALPMVSFAQDPISPEDAEAIQATVESAFDYEDAASVAFEAPIVYRGEIVQLIRFTDDEGRAWLGLYRMEREPDGHWRIKGRSLDRLAAVET